MIYQRLTVLQSPVLQSPDASTTTNTETIATTTTTTEHDWVCSHPNFPTLPSAAASTGTGAKLSTEYGVYGMSLLDSIYREEMLPLIDLAALDLRRQRTPNTFEYECMQAVLGVPAEVCGAAVETMTEGAREGRERVEGIRDVLWRVVCHLARESLPESLHPKTVCSGRVPIISASRAPARLGQSKSLASSAEATQPQSDG